MVTQKLRGWMAPLLVAGLLCTPAGCGDDDGAATDGGTNPDGAPPSDATADAGTACTVWEITYDLTGSLFEIAGTPLGAGDQVNTLIEPYDADDHVGPGTIVLRFQFVDGAPGNLAGIYSYSMTTNFVVNSMGATVATDLIGEAGPEDCGVTTGALAGDTVVWTPSAIVGHHSLGQILCTGGFCSMGGLPDGTPVPVDEITDQPLSDFVFATDLSSFTMAQTVIQTDSNSTTSWEYTGTETSRQQVTASACWCP